MTASYGVVTEFKDEFFFLSNFYVCPFEWRGHVYISGEHAFQAAKGFCMKDAYIHDITGYMDNVRAAPTPAKAKYLGRSVNLDVENWNKLRVQYMREIVHAKFRTSEDNLVGPLINTGAMMLVEGNDWGDTFWGRAKNAQGKWVGYNTLGVILMEERGWWSRGDDGRP